MRSNWKIVDVAPPGFGFELYRYVSSRMHDLSHTILPNLACGQTLTTLEDPIPQDASPL